VKPWKKNTKAPCHAPDITSNNNKAACQGIVRKQEWHEISITSQQGSNSPSPLRTALTTSLTPRFRALASAAFFTTLYIFLCSFFPAIG